MQSYLCRLMLFFLLSAPAIPASSPAPAYEYSWSGVKRIIVVGDIHGDYERFTDLLQTAGIINKNGKWIGGKTHLVQLGDIPDRGPFPRKIMDLLMKIEPQAKKAGGYVHVLIGNHEAMNIYGDLRYTSPEEFEEFRSSESGRIRQVFYEEEVKKRKKEAEAAGETFTPDKAFRRDWEAEHPLGFFEHRFFYGPNGPYGQWIRKHNTVIRIDDNMFVHAGIGPKYVDMSPEVINERVRTELNDFSLLAGGIVLDEEGPLWYRGLAEGDETELAAHVDAVLQNFGVKRIIIGHTPTLTTILPRFGGKVIMADVGLSKYYGGPPACVVIEQGKPQALYRGKKIAIPSDTGADLIDYLRKAAALDPPPSPIEKLIEQLQQRLETAPVK